MNQYTSFTLNSEDKSEEVMAFGKAIGLARIAPGRISALLLIDLYLHAILLRQLNPYKVLYEIQSLEGTRPATGTKPSTPFDHKPLRGLWHKHHLSSGLRSHAINLRQGLKRDGLPVFEQRVKEATASGEERFLEAEDIAAIINDAVIGNWERGKASNKLTGEWLIFAKHEDQNYYLCLGQHDSGDDALYEKIKGICFPEFPFLQDILS